MIFFKNPVLSVKLFPIAIGREFILMELETLMK